MGVTEKTMNSPDASIARAGAEPVYLFIQEAILPNGFCACVIMKRCDII